MNNQTFKDIRHYMDLTQVELADKLGITREHVAQIETNRIRVTERTQAKLMHHFKVTDDFLVYQQSKRDIEQLLKNDNK